LQRGQAFINENIPFCNQEFWRYVKALCFGDIVDNICNDCKPFVLSIEFDEKEKDLYRNNAITKQFNELCCNVLKGKHDKGSMVLKIIFYFIMSSLQKSISRSLIKMA